MKIVVRAELVTDWGKTKTIEVPRFDRPVPYSTQSRWAYRLLTESNCSPGYNK